MPDLVLEKGGQTHRFKLYKDKSVTGGKSIYIPFNGRDYYARYGDTPTPLEVEIKGIKQYVQYEPGVFQTISWEGWNRRWETASYEKTVYFPKGRYLVYMEMYHYRSTEIYINEGEEKTIKVTVEQGANRYNRYRLSIQGVFDDYIDYDNYTMRYKIERIGD
jgi:hypothetical protein